MARGRGDPRIGAVPRILMVEDNPINRELALALLELDGHEVIQAANARELRAQLAAGVAADVVLLDILLPDAFGTTLVAEVRGALGPVPLVALTAQALPGDRERFLAAGFDEVMTKPIDTRRFAADVAALIRR